jgi:hypothetical protein
MISGDRVQIQIQDKRITEADRIQGIRGPRANRGDDESAVSESQQIATARVGITPLARVGAAPCPGPDDIRDMPLHRSVTDPATQGAGLNGSYVKRREKDARDRREVLAARPLHADVPQMLKNPMRS